MHSVTKALNNTETMQGSMNATTLANPCINKSFKIFLNSQVSGRDTHPVGYAGPVVHSAASGAQTLMHYFLSLGGTITDSTKSGPGHVTPSLFVCIRWDLWVT
jgi:hypothetical protein